MWIAGKGIPWQLIRFWPANHGSDNPQISPQWPLRRQRSLRTETTERSSSKPPRMARTASAGSQGTNSPDSHARNDQIAHGLLHIYPRFCYQVALLAGRQRSRQKMRCGSLDFVEYASQMRQRSTMRSFAAALVSHPGGSCRVAADHPIQGIVLAKEENLVLPPEVVVQICRRKRRRRRNVAHCRSLRKTAHAELSSRGTQDLQSSRKIAPPEMAVALISSQGWGTTSFSSTRTTGMLQSCFVC